jgi:pyruvate dehydrogenase E1 component beta subunit
VPLTIRAAQGGGAGFGTQHSQCAEAWLMNFPGIKIVSPGTVSDMYGLLRSAIREDNPVVVLEHKGLYTLKGDLPEDAAPIPLGKANILREGTDVTVVALQLMLHRALQAADQLAEEGISCEVIDLRCVNPLDSDTILTSIAKTNRLVVAEEAPDIGGWGSDIAALAARDGIYYLEAPVKRVNLGGALIAYSPPLEDHALPNVERIAAGIRETVNA